MSKKKKKGKPATKKTAARKKVTRKSASKSLARAGARLAATGGRTSQITIFVFKTGTGTKIRTAPQRAYAGPGFVEWTVVNMVDGSNIPATITWPDGGPWGKEPIEIRDGMERREIPGEPKGRYKYVVHALDAQEDPEVEIPEM
jgi:hypothetical protein